ncbi:MAG: glutaminyl-peptide cyclotransferase [Desulfovibrio sp.]|nr:MAG: glutaminyl-peptide cyclotransferase [Desulfovibrio sp.]
MGALAIALYPGLFMAAGWVEPAQAQAGGTPRVQPRIVAALPHDSASFVQGFLFHQGRFYESRGRYGESELRVLDPASAEVLQLVELPDEIFAEGLVLVDDMLFQLTWKENRVYVWDVNTLEPIREYLLFGEGWGAAYDGERIIISDGSHVLKYYSPDNFAPQGELAVFDQGEPVILLNELEWVDGMLLANVWMSSDIAVIDPESGQVALWLDCSWLCARAGWHPDGKDLNGIAYDADAGRLWLTGKRWDVVFEVEVAWE